MCSIREKFQRKIFNLKYNWSKVLIYGMRVIFFSLFHSCFYFGFIQISLFFLLHTVIINTTMDNTQIYINSIHMQLCLCMYLFKKSFHSLNFTPFNCRRTICMVSKNWPIFFFSLFIALPFPFFFHFFESKKSECFQLEMCTVFFSSITRWPFPFISILIVY